MKVIVTGANGFIGRNLCVRLGEMPNVQVLPIAHTQSQVDLQAAVAQADFVFHLAGVNRPQTPEDFVTGNADFTQLLCNALAGTERSVPVVYTSSTQVALDNAYGHSKLVAEQALVALSQATLCSVIIYRLPNVFGKWARPNYNSAVATFCHNIAHGLPITIHDPTATLRLVYVDDVIDAFLGMLIATHAPHMVQQADVAPVYATTVAEVAQAISGFHDTRDTLLSERVGSGLTRALHATYLSYLPPTSFKYPLVQHADARGVFVEMLRTHDSGQFSYFTAHPGITRGGHYHHTKNERFLVVRGEARFKFRNVNTNETYEVLTSGQHPEIVETVPGWAHDITNIGNEEMVVLLWANELFDKARPDTIACKL